MFAKSATASLVRGALVLGTALMLGGCVTGFAYTSPAFEVSTGAEIYQPPPPLPDYAQPPCPGDGYLWVPGYWAYSGGYYWVPGTWVMPPQVGFLWTPGYWGFAGGAYIWHAGYWGPHVGFYGGVHYGFGYDGEGYVGGRWEGAHFVYNRDVTNINGNAVHFTYFQRTHRRFASRVSYDGGRGGIVAYPSRADRRFEHDTHVGATFSQRTHRQQAARNQALFARDNGGHPPFAATRRPGQFQGPGLQRTRGAERFGPQGARSDRSARPNFRSRPAFLSRGNVRARPSFQARPYVQAHPNIQRRPRYQTRPAFRGQRFGARPRRRVAGARRGPTGRPQTRSSQAKPHRGPRRRDPRVHP